MPLYHLFSATIRVQVVTVSNRIFIADFGIYNKDWTRI
jgi:hypothetical protein